MGTYLHVSRREVNQNPVTKPGLKPESCYQARTKARISSDVLAPKNSLRSHLAASNSKKLFLGSMPPHPPTFCVHTNIATRVFVPIRRTNTTPSPLRSDYSSYTGHLYEITLGHCCRGQELCCTLIVLYMACLSLCFITLQYPTYTLGVCWLPLKLIRLYGMCDQLSLEPEKWI